MTTTLFESTLNSKILQNDESNSNDSEDGKNGKNDKNDKDDNNTKEYESVTISDLIVSESTLERINKKKFDKNTQLIIMRIFQIVIISFILFIIIYCVSEL